MILDLIAIIAPVFIVAGIGFVWGRSPAPFATEFVSRLVVNVTGPCLIFSTLVDVSVPLASIGRMAGAALLALCGFGLVGFAALRLLRLPLRVFLPSLVFPNTGNLGLPLSLFAFGEPGLAFAVTYFTLTSIGNFTLGRWITSGGPGFGRAIRQPLLYAVALALILALAGIEPPAWIDRTTTLLGDATIPLMLLSLGVALARIQPSGVGRAFLLSVLRIAMGLAIGLAIASILDLDHTARGVLVLLSAAPTAVFNYLFAQVHARQPEEVAGLVMVSTLIYFVLLPGLLVLVL